jgi:exosortase/archaeosortase family protein
MITVFLIWYLHSFSRDFRFPAALLLFPLAAVLIWLSNCLRIVLLVGIGTSISSEVAAEGYHANGGWICFILVSLGMVVLARRSPVFLPQRRSSHVCHRRRQRAGDPVLGDAGSHVADVGHVGRFSVAVSAPGACHRRCHDAVVAPVPARRPRAYSI